MGGVIVVGLIWPLLLLAGLLMALLLLGLAFGWPLMWATISTEGTDAFDALSRSYAYLFQRPLRVLFYAFIAAVLGWLGWLLVVNFAAGVIWLTDWAAAWGCGGVRMADIENGTQAGSGVIHFWVVGVKFLAVGFRYGYFFTAAAAIYLLLRRDVDATETDEVFLDADASELLRGLPPLATDEKGAPVVKEGKGLGIRDWGLEGDECDSCLPPIPNPQSLIPSSNRPFPPRPVADLNRLDRRKDENLAVADRAFRTGPGDADDRVDGPLQKIVVDDDLQRDLSQQGRRVLVAAIHSPCRPR